MYNYTVNLIRNILMEIVFALFFMTLKLIKRNYAKGYY